MTVQIKRTTKCIDHSIGKITGKARTSSEQKLRGGVVVSHVDIRSAGSMKEIDFGDVVRIKGTLLGKQYNEEVRVRKFLTDPKYSIFGNTVRERLQFLKGRVHADLYEVKNKGTDVDEGSRATFDDVRYKTCEDTILELRIDDSKTIESGQRFSKSAADFIKKSRQVQND